MPRQATTRPDGDPEGPDAGLCWESGLGLRTSALRSRQARAMLASRLGRGAPLGRKEGTYEKAVGRAIGQRSVRGVHSSAERSRGTRRGLPPATLRGWDERLEQVRAGLKRSFGRMPDRPCPLDPEILGTLARPGYAIERLTFQSRPGVRVTANLYRPDPVQQALPRGAFGPRTLGLGSHGPARPAPVHRTCETGLCRSLRGRLRRRRKGDRARARNVPRRIDRSIPLAGRALRSSACRSMTTGGPSTT